MRATIYNKPQGLFIRSTFYHDWIYHSRTSPTLAGYMYTQYFCILAFSRFLSTVPISSTSILWTIILQLYIPARSPFQIDDKTAVRRKERETPRIWTRFLRARCWSWCMTKTMKSNVKKKKKIVVSRPPVLGLGDQSEKPSQANKTTRAATKKLRFPISQTLKFIAYH